MPEPGSSEPQHWFEPVAEHLGSAYLRYSFTKGTEQEVAFLVDALGLAPGQRVLDVGCGPGRHALALAARGIEVVGIDISHDSSTSPGGTRRRRAGNVRAARRPRLAVLRRRVRCRALACARARSGSSVPAPTSTYSPAWREQCGPEGACAVSAFSSYFQVRYPQEAGTFDAASASTTSTR